MAPDVKPDPEPHRVMVVEDDAMVRTNAAEYLRTLGMQVVEAVNADEAWSYLQTGTSVDLIFSDVQMPGSMDGVELARRVRANYPDIAMVITTGDARPQVDDVEHLFIAKPYRLSRVATIITLILDEK